MPFPYKTVLVTGATSGIGRALSQRMIEAGGIYVIAVGRNRARLDELAATYGPEKIAIEQLDVSDLSALRSWSERIVKTYPSLDCVFLNAGFQQMVDFTDPETSSRMMLEKLDSEVRTNYLAVLHLVAHFLPHLIARHPEPAAVALVSSCLALAPQPQTANYCASKAAVHSLAWSLRAQLDGREKEKKKTDHVRVIELLPPAVKTELHLRQGRDELGMELGDYVDDTWAQLTADEDVLEIIPMQARRQGMDKVEDEKRKLFEGFRLAC
ncbi:NAD(P)-binding protein [Xylariaceae sp. FL0594]|nr:NAD(P)-binding protein [Xylariaceae sp. FL0594]